MSQQAPPPPPPHGAASSNGAKPDVKYDVFVIPDTGSGFLYLPSLQPNINSFVAGFASALALVVLFQSLAPAFRIWWHNMQGMGNMGVLLLLIAVGLGAWSLGRQNQDGSGGPGAGGSAAGSNGARTNAGPPPNAGPQPQPQSAPNTEMPGGPKPQPSWGQSRPAAAGKTGTESAPKNAWEKAREETRKREEERKAKEAEEKRREEAARRLRELREKEARERQLREKEAREREQREKEIKERAAKKEEAEAAGKGSTYAYSSVGERTNPWPSGTRPTVFAAAAAAGAAASTTQSEASPSRPRVGAAAQSEARSSPTRPPAPTAKTYLGTEEETYSFRPYDKPAAAKQPQRKKSFSEGSEWSWAPSQSTSRTTPPPSARAPYTTKDPDKIVIKAVYSFANQFAKTPASQLISGVGSVTDGLILRITTEGLFIDDDVRGVAQREWDVKAWTLKLVEVWCPHYGAIASSATPGATQSGSSFLKAMAGGGIGTRTRGNGEAKALSGDDADAYLADMLRACKDCCRLGLYSSSGASQSNASSSDSGYSSAASRSSYTDSNSGRGDKTGEWKAKALHLLRATIRDQEGKRYLFVITEEESWKVAVGLQRLRRGTQVRALGVAGLSGLETKSTLEMLGWAR